MNLVKPLWKQLKDAGATPTRLLHWAGMVLPAVDVDRLASMLGVRVVYVPNVSWSGAVMVAGADATIQINANEPKTRQRFTLAHELGHLMLHPISLAFRDTTFDGTPQEREANQFAADLLMPMWMVGPVAMGARSDAFIASLAREFGVSQAAVSRRLQASMGVPDAKVPVPLL